ncbi:MAG: hypothetical protein GX119_01030 [Syntrophomonadaceae bacterium]|nr:hypothetical protein [Syntrophomonadaceae bacterium]
MLRPEPGHPMEDNMLLLLIVIYLAIIALEVPILLREGRRKELLVFAFLLLPGVCLTLAQYFGWYVPNPLAGVIALTAGWR